MSVIPIFNKELTAIVYIHPSQMTNSLYSNIKNNLKNKIENKCYRNYGYINKIIEITKYSNGEIEPENNTSSAKINVVFAASIISPNIDTIIVCKISSIVRTLITLTAGPIKIYVSQDDISKKFDHDYNNNIYYLGKTDKLKINIGDYLRVKIINRVFHDSDVIITALGFIEDMACEKDIELFKKYLE